MFHPLMVFFFIGLFANGVWAASFDCKQELSQLEKSICDNQTLSRLDNKLSYQYKNIRDDMPRLYFYRDRIIELQNSWLKQRNQQCGNLINEEQLTCLKQQYEARSLVLEKIIHAPVSMQIISQCHNIATQSYRYQNQDGCYDETFLDRRKLNQALGFDIEQLDIFNPFIQPNPESSVKQCYRDYADRGNIDVHEVNYSEDINYLNDHIVSVLRQDGSYTGGAHGINVERLYSLDLTKHKLVTWIDLFGDNADVELYITQRVMNEIADKAYLSYFNKDAEQLAETINSFKATGYFNIRDEGLFIQYQAYMIGPYAAGLPSLTISLQELRPFMTAEKYDYYFAEPIENQLVINCPDH